MSSPESPIRDGTSNPRRRRANEAQFSKKPEPPDAGCDRWAGGSLVIVLLACGRLLAADYTLDWDVVSPGGGTSGGSTYLLRDTVGQPAAGPSTGGAYLVEDGFWPGMNTAPLTAQERWLRSTNRTVKARLTSLTTNVWDLDGDTFAVSAVDALTARGGTITDDNGWLLYTPCDGFNESDNFTYTVTDAEGNQAVGSVIIEMAGGNPGQPRAIVSLHTLGDGRRIIRFVGIAGRSYSIQATSDLAHPVWQELGTSVAG
ncbi:MAG: Ig-like domain-containing protein, partial [Verrucomicrobia bacterium]|nr:Ig-like domain-containing protein [Verrucomicrobiota bacterium]